MIHTSPVPYHCGGSNGNDPHLTSAIPPHHTQIRAIPPLHVCPYMPVPAPPSPPPTCVRMSSLCLCLSVCRGCCGGAAWPQPLLADAVCRCCCYSPAACHSTPPVWPDAGAMGGEGVWGGGQPHSRCRGGGAVGRLGRALAGVVAVAHHVAVHLQAVAVSMRPITAQPTCFACLRLM